VTIALTLKTAIKLAQGILAFCYLLAYYVTLSQSGMQHAMKAKL